MSRSKIVYLTCVICLGHIHDQEVDLIRRDHDPGQGHDHGHHHHLTVVLDHVHLRPIVVDLDPDLEPMDLRSNNDHHHHHHHHHLRMTIDIKQLLAKRQTIRTMHIADPTATTTIAIIDQRPFVSTVPRYRIVFMPFEKSNSHTHHINT